MFVRQGWEVIPTREYNKRVVLDLIRTRYPISRTQIAEITHLNKATISSIVSEFISKGVVAEIGNATSAVGRRPILLGFVPDSAYVIGLVVYVDYIHVALTNLEGQIVWELKRELNNTSTDEVLTSVVGCIHEALSQDAGSSLGVVAIGVGVPALVDFESGTIVHSPNLQLSSINLKQYLEMEFSIPVFVDNSANVAAFGEKLFGVAKRFRHFVYVSVSTGIGVGIFMNGQLQRGAAGFAGELGHMVVEPRGLKCSCGGTGCWEMYGSLKALYRQVADHVQDVMPEYHPDVLHAVVQAAQAEDTWALEGLYYIAYYLGIGISNIVNIFNPEAIIIGNKITPLARWIRPMVETALQTRCSAKLVDQLNLIVSDNGENTVVIGAASLGIDGFMEQITR
ncbi:ROK family protein [Alicyclobacillus kakegawensis]|uniref:ROK family protein n=1 Tax=Alicyclobacillus kakegawensis TaxID=392012 RepID=UPI00082BAAFF|nr:ROK family protein [Alicyclobacillus kakegawensis]